MSATNFVCLWCRKEKPIAERTVTSKNRPKCKGCRDKTKKGAI